MAMYSEKDKFITMGDDSIFTEKGKRISLDQWQKKVEENLQGESGNGFKVKTFEITSSQLALASDGLYEVSINHNIGLPIQISKAFNSSGQDLFIAVEVVSNNVCKVASAKQEGFTLKLYY